MRLRLMHLCFSGLVGVLAGNLAVSAAHAFTMEGPAVDNQYAIPKFDLEEQAKNFSKDGSSPSMNSKGQLETPLGPGKLQFGVQQGPMSNFGFGGMGLGSMTSRAGRADFERAVTPEGLR